MCDCDVFVFCSLHHGVAHWNCIVFPGGERNCGVHELICVRKGRADQSSGRLTFDPCTVPPTPPVWSFITTKKHLCVCFWPILVVPCLLLVCCTVLFCVLTACVHGVCKACKRWSVRMIWCCICDVLTLVTQEDSFLFL